MRDVLRGVVRDFLGWSATDEGRVLIVAAILLVLSPPAWAQSLPLPGGGTDPFGGIVNIIDANLQRWCGALLAIGFVGVGASFAVGSHSSGTYARNVLFASLFLLLAGTAGGVLSVLAKARALTGNAF